MPEPPDHLGPEALAEWHRLVPDLYKAGLLTTFDVGVMAAYCCSYGHWVIAERFLAQAGEMHLVAWIGGTGALSPTHVPGYAMRTYSGRPRSSIRFSTSAAIATSLA